MNNIFFYLFQGLSDESLNINVKFALNYLRKLFNNMANNVIGENIIAIVLNEFINAAVFASYPAFLASTEFSSLVGFVFPRELA